MRTAVENDPFLEWEDTSLRCTSLCWKVYRSEKELTELAANFRNFGKSHPVRAR
jgi:hypothetical protein